MKLDNIQGIAILTDTIKNNLRHCDYLRTLEIAKDYKAYVTGCGIDLKLKQFNLREDDKLFDQRKRITQSITPDIANSIMNPMYKVGRTPATMIVDWKGAEDTSKNKAELFDAANNFYGHESVNDYLSYRLPELDSTDPNSFIAVEFAEKINPEDLNAPKAEPYPFEISSSEAINYKFINNQLQFIIVNTYKKDYDEKGKECQLNKYTIYLDNVSIVAEEYTKQGFEKEIIEVEEGEPMPVPLETIMINGIQSGVEYLYVIGKNKENKNGRYFTIKMYEHNIGFVPVFRVGSRHDLITEGRTKVPLMHPAQPYFEKSIKTMSEFDLAIALHTFPQKIQYSDACLGQGEGETKIYCNAGYTPSGTKCKACNGSGFKYHQSSQDLIQLRMPKDLKDMVSLENVITYKAPPIDLLEFQKKYALYELRTAAQTAVYNSEVFSKDEVQQTATGKIIDLDAVYDTLQPFAKRYSTIWTGIIRAIASLRNVDTDIIVFHKFPNDFKMKSFSALLDDLVKANQNNAPSHIKNSITSDITKKLYIDQPNEVLKIETKNKYMPFQSKTENEIQFIISNDLTDTYNKTLYIFFDKIFHEIEYEQGLNSLNFYAMSETMQRELLDKKVNEYSAKLETTSFDTTANAFASDSSSEDDAEDITNVNQASLSPAALEAEAKAKANLKGSVGGVQGILAIQASVVAGTTDYDSALAILEVIFGIPPDDAKRILGEPKAKEEIIEPVA
jgi:hypothetical protein